MFDEAIMIESGIMKVFADPVANVESCQIQITIYNSSRANVGMWAFPKDELAQGVDISVPPRHTVQIELLITPNGNHATVLPRFVLNGITIWDRECICFLVGTNGFWKYKAR